MNKKSPTLEKSIPNMYFIPNFVFLLNNFLYISPTA